MASNAYKLPENKKDFRRRLEGLGLWERFMLRRRQLQSKGMVANDYWPKLMDEFSPGRCVEITGKPGPRSAKAKAKAKLSKPPVSKSPMLPPPGLMFPVSFNNEGEPVPAVVSVDDVDPVEDDDEGGTDDVYIGGKKVGRDILANGMPLVDSKTWDGRPGITFEESVLWSDSMRAIRNVKPADCPSAVAYEKLWSAQNSLQGAQYLDSLVGKITAKRKSSDDDDASDITAYTSRLIEMVASAKAETAAAS